MSEEKVGSKLRNQIRKTDEIRREKGRKTNKASTIV
jgi:hypothetical protein